MREFAGRAELVDGGRGDGKPRSHFANGQKILQHRCSKRAANRAPKDTEYKSADPESPGLATACECLHDPTNASIPFPKVRVAGSTRVSRSIPDSGFPSEMGAGSIEVVPS